VATTRASTLQPPTQSIADHLTHLVHVELVLSRPATMSSSMNGLGIAPGSSSPALAAVRSG
jgi:hypothetical protein